MTTTTADRATAARDIMAKVEALQSDLSDAQRAKIEALIDEKLASHEPPVRKAGPATNRAGGSVLTGTKYETLGMTEGDAQLVYALSAAGASRGMSRGPSEQLRNIVAEIDKRDVAAYGADKEFKSRDLDTAESGYGNQLIGAQYVTSLWDAARAESRIMSLIDSFPMNAPTAYLPVRGAPPVPILMAESTASNSSNYTVSRTGSNRVTVTAYKLGMHQMWSEELEEDSIIPFVPFLGKEAADSISHYGDALVLNGDNTNAGTGNINSDDADPADTEYFLAFDGIRHSALVDATGQKVDVAGAITWKHLTATAKGLLIDTTYLTDWGTPNNPADLIYACEPNTALAIGQLDEVVKARETQPGSLTYAGQIGAVLGHPVISTIAIPKTDADGKYTTTTPTSNDTKGQVAVFNRRGYVVGWRRQVTVKLEDIPGTDQKRIVYTWRLGLGRYSNTGAASGIKHTAVLYDISL